MEIKPVISLDLFFFIYTDDIIYFVNYLGNSVPNSRAAFSGSSVGVNKIGGLSLFTIV